MSVLSTFRDLIQRINPTWMQRGTLLRLSYSFGLQVDAFGDALNAGLRSRFPGNYSAESLPWIGNERRIRRGLFETDDAYAERLRFWFRDHHARGGPYALLNQLYLHYSPNNFPIDLVYRSGRTFSMDTNGVITISDQAFNPDAHPELWARWWLFYYTDTWSSTPSAAERKDIVTIPREWNTAHAQGKIVLFPTGAFLIGYHPPHLIDEPDTIDTTVSTVTLDVE